MYPESLAVVGELDPEATRGWSYPNVRRDYTRSVLAPAALVLLQVWERACPEAAAHDPRRPVRGGDVALPPGHAAAGAGGGGGRAASCTCGPSTTREHIKRLEALGVAGVITNDPRLFAPDSRRRAS